MMREYIPGEDLSSRWRTLSLEQKQSIAHDLARYLAQLYRIRFDKIGGLVYEDPPTPTPAQHTSLSYLWNTLWSWLWTWLAWICPIIVDWVTASALHTASPPPRKIVVGQDSTILSVGLYKGPFTNASDWFQARLLDIGLLQVGFAEEPEPHMPENKVNYIRETFKWIDFVRRRPSLSLDETVTTIYHPITAESIIISDEGKVAGLLDWDEVCACPLWAVTEVPDVILGEDHERAVTIDGFIQSRQSTNREIPPEQHAAFVEAVAVSTNLDMRDCYFEYLLPDLPWLVDSAIYSHWPEVCAFEKTQMRKVFHATMADLAPDWVDLRSSRRMDMAIAAGLDEMAWGSLVWFGQFEEETLGPLASAAMSRVAWLSDDDTMYESSDGDSDREA